MAIGCVLTILMMEFERKLPYKKYCTNMHCTAHDVVWSTLPSQEPS